MFRDCTNDELLRDVTRLQMLRFVISSLSKVIYYKYILFLRENMVGTVRLWKLRFTMKWSKCLKYLNNNQIYDEKEVNRSKSQNIGWFNSYGYFHCIDFLRSYQQQKKRNSKIAQLETKQHYSVIINFIALVNLYGGSTSVFSARRHTK